MPVDPNDLLIFKIRSERAQQEKGTTSKQKVAARTNEKVAQHIPYTPPNSQASRGAAAPSKPSNIKQQPAAEEMPNENILARELNQIYAQPYAEEGAGGEPENYGETSLAAYEKEKELFENVMPVQEAAGAPTGATTKGKSKKNTKGEKESIEAAKGLMCVNHPWRPAYAICDYCKRPFCYADLVEYNGKFYCLEDIDKVVGTTEKNPSKVSYATRISGILFIANVAFLGYFIMPQTKFLIYSIEKVGIMSFITSLNYSYALSIINFLFVALGAIIGLLLVAGLRKSAGAGGILGALMLVVASYEYLNSTAVYLVVVSIISFVTLGALGYGSVSNKVIEEEENKEQTDILWPKVETF